MTNDEEDLRYKIIKRSEIRNIKGKKREEENFPFENSNERTRSTDESFEWKNIDIFLKVHETCNSMSIKDVEGK